MLHKNPSDEGIWLSCVCLSAGASIVRVALVFHAGFVVVVLVSARRVVTACESACLGFRAFLSAPGSEGRVQQTREGGWHQNTTPSDPHSAALARGGKCMYQKKAYQMSYVVELLTWKRRKWKKPHGQEGGEGEHHNRLVPVARACTVHHAPPSRRRAKTRRVSIARFIHLCNPFPSSSPTLA